MNRSDFVSGDYIKADALLKEVGVKGLDLTIKGVEKGELPDGKPQPIITFKETDRKMGCNTTNINWLCDYTSCGNDLKGWVGSKVNIYPHKLDRPFNGATHGLRIREPQSGSAPPDSVLPPPASAPGPVKTKIDAWKAWQAAAPDGKPNVQSWGKAVLEVASGREEGTLTAEDWKAVAGRAELPF